MLSHDWAIHSQREFFTDHVDELVFFTLFTLGSGTGHSLAISLVLMKITSDVFSFAVQYLLMFHYCPVPMMARKVPFLLAFFFLLDVLKE